MKERVVTTVGIRHHRVEKMPQLMRLSMNGSVNSTSRRAPIDAARGLLIALTLSGLLWVAVVAAIGL